MLTISRSASSVRRRGHLGDVQRHGAVGEAAALVDLGLLGAGDDVARGQLQLVGRVLLHEALALGVEQPGALAAGALGDQQPVARQRRRVVLDHLHVHQPGADPVGLGDAVAGHDQPVGGGPVGLAGAAGGEDHGLGVEHLQARRRAGCGRSRRCSARRRPGAGRW